MFSLINEELNKGEHMDGGTSHTGAWLGGGLREGRVLGQTPNACGALGA